MSRPRIASIDALRGVVMILMSLDHVRVYSGLPAGGDTPGIFFTRWITHFCAPTFVLLAGASAYLQGRDRSDLSRRLLVRGAWLIVLEFTVLRFAWTFNTHTFFMAGVIWAIGVCMILLALLVKLPLRVVGAVGLVLVAGHDLADPYLDEWIPAANASRFAALWKILYLGFWGGPIELGSSGVELIVLYSIVPWVGVMACGYALGGILALEPRRRDRSCAAIGAAAIGLFLVLRGFNLYGDPRPWTVPDGADPLAVAMAVLDANKYPASLAFLSMTLGPVLVAIPMLERWKARVPRTVTTFGRVPLFYYLLHVPLIHGVALLVSLARMGEVSPWLFADHPMRKPPPPDGYTWSFAWLYGITVLVNLLLAPASAWFARIKAGSDRPWTRLL